VLATILRETTTLGARRSRLERAALSREIQRVETPFGALTVKVASNASLGIWRAWPEWEDVKRAAQSASVPAGEVFEAAQRAAEDFANALWPGS
jgi:uncharacterized protein (DUF111 family)